MSCVPRARWPSGYEQGEQGFRHFLRPRERVSLPAAVHRYISDSRLDTFIQEGKIPVRLGPSGKVLESGAARETRRFKGKDYLMETALNGDVAILRAWKADEVGNCVFRQVHLIV